MQQQFRVTDKFIETLRDHIEAKDTAFIRESLRELHPADIADILDMLKASEARFLYDQVDEEDIAKVLVEMEDEKREKFLTLLTSQEIAGRVLEHMPSDDAADVISDLPDSKQDEVLALVEDQEQASDIADLLKYDENTAGGLMAKELVKVSVEWNVLECVRQMRRQAEHMESVYAVYACDANDRLVGILPLQKLLTTPVRSKIRDVIEPEVISVRTDTPDEEVANIMDKYNIVVLPVVDHLGKLVGRITIDDVIDLIRKEQTEDIQKMGGMEAIDKPYMNISFREMISKRSGWLVILLIGESFTATAMGFFEDQIAKAVVLALFVPLIISSGGNTGSQAATLITRAIALNEVGIAEWWKIIRREMSVGFVLGLLLGAVGFLRVALWSVFVNVYGPDWVPIAFTVGVSLTGVVLWGNLVGSILPIFLKRIGLDPAVSSAPFVATIVDVTGLIIYFTVAALFLRGMLI